MSYSKEFLTAINQWQTGTSPDREKQRSRGQRLKNLASDIPSRVRRVDFVCFRQITLEKQFVWKLGDELHLAEGISAWTMSTDVAKGIKGGPPHPVAKQHCVIFEHMPRAEEVIVNLSLLHQDEEFQRACAEFRLEIPGFSGGIGRYGTSQAEVILEIERLSLDSVYALGGWSSSREDFLEMLFGPHPTPAQIRYFDDLLAMSGRKLGPEWLTDGSMKYVRAKMLEAVEVLRPFKAKSGMATHSAEGLESRFSSKALGTGAVLILSEGDAIAMVRLAQQNNLPVLGVDGFHLLGTSVQPATELSLACSAGTRCWQEAEDFIRAKASEAGGFEVVLGDPL